MYNNLIIPYHHQVRDSFNTLTMLQQANPLEHLYLDKFRSKKSILEGIIG